MAQTTVPAEAESTRRPQARRPGGVRRRLAAVHRCTSLVSAGFLVMIMAAGLLWGAETFRAKNPDIYQPTTSSTPLMAQEALEVVGQAPDYATGNVISDEWGCGSSPTRASTTWSHSPSPCPEARRPRHRVWLRG